MLTRRERWLSYALVGPALIGLLVFRIWPVGLSFWQSLQGIPGREAYVGLRNYADLSHNPSVWHSLITTLVFNAIINPLQVLLAFALALLTNMRIAGASVYRAAVMAPITTSITVTSILWGVMLNPSFGPTNSALAYFHVPPQPFLTSATQAMPSLILLATWRGMGYWMVFFLAGLQDIPSALYEAAAIDGASAWSALRTITVPLMVRVFVFVLAADTAANFLLFVPVYLLTAGGPQMSTDLMMYEAYKHVFVYLDLGHGMALTSILLVLVIGIVAVQLRLFRG